MANIPKILYVDDEKINLMNFVRVFERDFEVLTANSGEEALELFMRDSNLGLCAVVSDQRMGGMSGVELLTRILEYDPDPTRIILTAYADFKDLSEAVNKGHIYQYVQKPWEYQTLKPILLRAVEACVMAKYNKSLVKELAQRNLDLHNANDQLAEELHKNKLSEEQRREVEILMLAQAKLASLGEMATGIAHEINQPLSYIRIMLQAVKEDCRNDRFELDGFLEDADESLVQIGRISTIIDHMRTFGRSDITERCPVFLPEIIDNSLIPLRQRLRLGDISLRVNSEKELPMVMGASTQLEQVLINLIVNAIDSLENISRKEISIDISATSEELLLSLTDTGCGMSPQVAGRIFEPFYTTKDVGKGTGIGLAISYGIIRDHQGTILCTSEEGKGSTFTISLPVCATDQ